MECKPIPFIIKSNSESSPEYQVTAEATEFLSKIHKPFSIVTVAGLYRTGKSYLLNRIVLNKDSGFGVGSTVNACTKGLWLWGELLENIGKNYLVIDTEGLGALDEQTNHDMKIICLAVLLSTTFIYNSQGSIDENALQTLSLVLNLVTNIDQQEISMRPDLVWVVRDFSLQLIDDKGRSITPKEYLELALASGNIKETQKLQIRNTITAAFKQRDCFTLVKPLIDQNKLQNLDKIPQSNLRAQFLQQSLELRNKIMSGLKPLALNGKNEQNISGADYIRMAEQYVSSINNGKVPCMLDTWTYIREEKARQAVEQIRKKCGEQVRTNIAANMPFTSVALEKVICQLSEAIYSDFNRLTYDGTSTVEIDELIASYKTELSRMNHQRVKTAISNLITKEYQPYQKKLISLDYSSVEQFKSDMNDKLKPLLVEKYKEKFDNDKLDEYLASFLQSRTIDAYSHFDRCHQKEILKQKEIMKEIESKTTKQIEILTKNAQEDRRNLRYRIEELEKENSDLQLGLGKLDTERSMSSRIVQEAQNKNAQLLALVEKLTSEINQKNAQCADSVKAIYIKERQVDKDRAVFVQKEKQLQQQIHTLQKSLKEAQVSLRETTDRFTKEKRQIIGQCEQKVSRLDFENQNLREKIAQITQNQEQAMRQITNLKAELKNITDKHKEQQSGLKKKLLEVQSNHTTQNLTKKLQSQLREAQQVISQLKYQTKNFEIQNKQLNDQLKNAKFSNESEMAIHLQKMQFQDIEIKDLKERNEELRKNYQEALGNIQDNSKSIQQNFQLKIYEEKAQFEARLNEELERHEEETKYLNRQINSLRKSKDQLQLQLSLQKKNIQSRERQWKQTNESLQQLCQKMEQKLMITQRDHQDLYREKENYFKLRVKQLEQELEQIKQKNSQQLRENQVKSQEAVAVLKKYADMEKMNWEKRLSDEKEKSQRKLKNLSEQLEQKFAEEKQTMEEENMELQDRISTIERSYSERMQNMKYDYDINLQKTVNKFMDEKVELTKQNALMEQELSLTKKNLERQIQEMKLAAERQNDQAKKAVITEYEQALARLKDEKETLQSKYDSLRKCNKTTEQENLKLKAEMEKEKAVFKQKYNTLQRKLSETENNLQQELKTYNETIQKINEGNNAERKQLNAKIEHLQQLNFTLEEQKNQMKSEFESEKNLLETKCAYNQNGWNRSKEDYQDILAKFGTTVKHLSNERQKLKNENGNHQTIFKIQEQTNRIISEEKEKYARYSREHLQQIEQLKKQMKLKNEKILLLQVRQENRQKNKNDGQIQSIKRKYEKEKQELFVIIKKLKSDLEYEKHQHARTIKQNSESFLQHSILADRSDRNSISGINRKSRYQEESRNIDTIPVNKKATRNTMTYQTSGTRARVIDPDEEFTGVKRYHKN